MYQPPFVNFTISSLQNRPDGGSVHLFRLLFTNLLFVILAKKPLAKCTVLPTAIPSSTLGGINFRAHTSKAPCNDNSSQAGLFRPKSVMRLHFGPDNVAKLLVGDLLRVLLSCVELNGRRLSTRQVAWPTA